MTASTAVTRPVCMMVAASKVVMSPATAEPRHRLGIVRVGNAGIAPDLASKGTTRRRHVGLDEGRPYV